MTSDEEVTLSKLGEGFDTVVDVEIIDTPEGKVCRVTGVGGIAG